MRSRWPDYRIDLGTLVQARTVIVKSEPWDFWIDQKANQIQLDSIPQEKESPKLRGPTLGQAPSNDP